MEKCDSTKNKISFGAYSNFCFMQISHIGYLSSDVNQRIPWNLPVGAEHLKVHESALTITVAKLILKKKS